VARLILVLLAALVAAPAAQAASAPRADLALDRAVDRLVRMKGGPPGAIVTVHRNGSDGTRSATVSINQQITPTVGRPAAFRRLRAVFELASCSALAGRG
jgi:hypothetical protein